jgi:hypothetical protein
MRGAAVEPPYVEDANVLALERASGRIDVADSCWCHLRPHFPRPGGTEEQAGC